MKQIRSKILISIVMFFLFVVCIIKSSFSAYYVANGIDYNKYDMGGEYSASLQDYCLTTDDLRKYGLYKTGLNPTFIESTQIITDWLGKYAIQENRDLDVLKYKSPIHRYGMACVGHGNSDINTSAVTTLYKVEAIIDIDTAAVNSTGVPGTIKVNLPGKSAITGTSNSITFPFVRLAYLASKLVEGASQDKEPQNRNDIYNGLYDEPQYMEAQYDDNGNLKAHGNPYKMAISDIFYNNYKSLSTFGLETKFSTTGPNAAADYKTGGKLAGTTVATQLTNVLNNATSYENQTKNYKFSVVTNNGNIVNLNGKSYLGPFKIQTSQGKISGATVSGYTVAGYSTSIGGTTSAISSIPNNSNFYIVINGTVNASSVNITLNKQFTAYKARLVLLKAYTQSGGSGQSYMTYDGEEIILTKSITLTAKTGNLKVKKTDTDTGAVLANVEFKIYNTDIGQYVVKNSTSGAITFTTSESSATTFKTNSSGEFTVSKIPFGNYKVKETKNPNAGYGNVTAEKTGYVSIGTTKELAFTNKKQLVNLTIKKVDATTGERLGNVSFSIKMKSGDKSGKYLGYDASGKAMYSDKEIVMVTSASKDIVITGVYTGNYEFKEIKNANAGYQTDVNKIVKTGSISNASSNNFTITVQNTREYISLSGYVWEDIGDGKVTMPNNLYNESDSDKRIQGLTVYLCDNTITEGSKVIKYTTTDANGNYTFKDVSIKGLPNYYIVFTYNGMVYKSVGVNLNKDNGSKATDATVRNNFNNQYAIITQGQANNVSGNKTYDLKYNTYEYGSEINYGNTDGNKYSVTGVADQYYINANTWDAYSGGLNKIMTVEYIKENGISKIENINLGIIKREQPDLTLEEDIYNAKVSLGGETHIYKYSERNEMKNIVDTNGNKIYDARTMAPQARFEEDFLYNGINGNQYVKLSYTRAVYRSDFIPDPNSKNSDFNLRVMYEIKVINNATTLKAVVQEVTNYFDIKYSVNGITYGTQINNNGFISDAKSVDGSKVGNYNSGYRKLVLDGLNIQVDAGGEKSIYIEYEVDKSQLINVVNQDEIVKLDNIAEITSYSTKDSAGAVYAGIDRDSQPGNLRVDENNIAEGDRLVFNETYEDDTAYAPGLTLKLDEERKTTGKVFIDKSEGGQAQIREGDGLYTEEDSVLENAIVRLRNASDNTVAQVYDAELDKQEGQTGWKNAETTTDSNGDYAITGFLPGDYYIEYEWGNETYKVQDYKSTIVDESSYNAKNNNPEWYKTAPDKRESDAVDNYQLRQDIDGQSNTVTYSSKKKLTDAYNSGVVINYDKNAGIINKMISNTPVFKVNIEYNSGMSTMDEYERDENGYLKVENGYLVKKEGNKNIMKNIDFGIVERARQILDLDKNITNVKITLANGQEIINTQIIDGQIQNKIEYITYGPPSNGNNGYVKIEIDSEIVQGANLQVQYSLSAKNISELDYRTKQFYMYGSKASAAYKRETDIVTLTPNLIIDYLDENNFNVVDEAQWDSVPKDKREELITKYISESEELQNIVRNHTNLITTDNLNTKLSPLAGQNQSINTVQITATKPLSNNDETVVENNAEIIEVEKTGGSSLQTTPGNFIPGNTPKEAREADDATSEELMILPPTGNGVDYIGYIILATTSLGILFAGIILIKKYVLK